MMMQKEVGRDLLTEARTNWLEIIGRLKPGASLEAAGAELTAYLDSRAQATPARSPRRSGGCILLPADKGNSPPGASSARRSECCSSLTALALVLACVNVASLLVVRSVAREKEIAVRLALGARRSPLVRQFLTETLVLAALGGTAGLLIAPWAAGLLVASQPYQLGLDATGLDMRVFLFGLAVCHADGPARRTGADSRVEQGRACSGPRRISRRRCAARAAAPPYTTSSSTCQIAVSLVMLIGAAPLRPEPAQPELARSRISRRPSAPDLGRPRLRRLRRASGSSVSGETRSIASARLPGVQSVSLARTVPLAPGRQRQPVFNAPSGEVAEIDTNFVGPRYFHTLGIPLLRGREFRRARRKDVEASRDRQRSAWPGCSGRSRTRSAKRCLARPSRQPARPKSSAS